MNAAEVEKLTRIARNFPSPRVKMERTTTPEGEVYFAVSKGRIWHGVYAYDGPGGAVACTMTYSGEATENQIRDKLIMTARQELAVCNL